MGERTVRVHAFASVKGGVGKSTLAIACAKLLAGLGRKPVLVDGDMTGTSFADGLNLCAPRCALSADGKLDLLAPPEAEHYTVSETRSLRVKRRDGSREGMPRPPPYVNDVLNHLDRCFGEQLPFDALRVDAFLWRHEEDDGVLYLPSSSLRRDVGESLGWIRVLEGERFDWVRCLSWAFHILCEHRQDITDIVVDLPPGTVGLTHELLVLLYQLQEGRALPAGYPTWNQEGTRWTANPFLVLSTDRNDMLPALEYIGKTRGRIGSLRPLVNRVELGKDIDAIQEDAREMLGPALAATGLERLLIPISEYRETLGRLFRVGDLKVDDGIQELSKVLRLSEVRG